MELHEKRAAAFKVGFLQRLAESGIAPDQFFERLNKRADLLDQFGGGVSDVAKKLWGTGGQALQTGGNWAGNALISAPIVAGSALGMGQAVLEAPTEGSVQTLRKAEELALLERLTREIEERRRRRAGE